MEIERKKRLGLKLQTYFGSFDVKWFLCFGTLLNIIRNNELNISSQDIDIGVIGDINFMYQQLAQENKVENYIKSNDTGDILKVAFKDDTDVSIDVFRWLPFKGMYWHTYDHQMKFPKDGIPSKYLFKSMPVEVFDCPPTTIRKKREDMKYHTQGRPSMSTNGTWAISLPDAPAEGIDLQLPYMYGYFLDIAYPDWNTERSQFGQSVGYTEFETSSCEGLC
jgi:hypothetical protein